MRLVFERANGTIREDVTTEELPGFVVISGPNGSGKSNLLNAIADGSLRLPWGNTEPVGERQRTVRHFGLAELVPSVDRAQTASEHRQRYAVAYQYFAQQRENVTDPSSRLTAGQWAGSLREILLSSRNMTDATLDYIIAQSGRSIMELRMEDFRDYHPIIGGARDPFSISATEVFLAYHDRFNQNRLEQWRVQQGDVGLYPLTDDQFVENYGPPPWEVMDATLSVIGLPYRFQPPSGMEELIDYIARLKHLDTGDLVTVDQLSTGEQTLLTVALSLFTGDLLGRSIEMPRVLLLDEADASLHPTMIRSLVSVLRELFSERYGVCVFLTTHSPTTVALAPESSLFVMRRQGHPRLLKATRDEALASLVVGLPTLSVSVDNRRQVFVESEDDESCYQELYALVRARLDSPFSLHFIASGRGGQGNSEAVVRLVSLLRGAGNLRVQGIVDRDSRRSAPQGIAYCPNRYAIENLILDPLPLGVYLLRSNVISGMDLGDEGLRHFQVGPAAAQKIVNLVTQKVLGDAPLDAAVEYAGGFKCDVASAWLEEQGHGLEAKILDAYPHLKRSGKGLKRNLIRDALGDAPACVPEDAIELMKALLR